MIGALALREGAVVANNTGLGYLGVVNSDNLLPVKVIVTAITTAR